ncbi:MAG: asparagine synthase-related protein, partial [Chloroflexota bacterium]
HLLGDFALVIWDPGNQRLVCARDTSGQRSLYYRVDDRVFAAGSEIHQLFQDPAVPIAPNEERIRDYLVPLNMFRNEKDQAPTFYEGIFALPAGHVLVVDRDTATVRRYWDFAPPSEIRYRDDEQYAEHFRELFFEVVRARLRSNRPIGAQLSGGLDSSSIVCAAQELDRAGRAVEHGFTSYSLVFDGLECDESAFIRDVQAKYSLDARFIPSSGRIVTSLYLEPRGFMRGPGKDVNELDGVLGAASRDGIRTILSGEVADACTAGSRQVFDSLLRHGRYVDCWRQLRTYRRVTGETWRKTLAVSGLFPLLPLVLQRAGMVAYTRRVLARERATLLPRWMPDTLRLDLARRHAGLSIAAERGRRFSSPSRQGEYDLLYPPEVGNLPAGWPVEISRPYADRRLHEFLLAIPPEQKFAPRPGSDEFYAGSKLIVRRALRGILPESIRTRSDKSHFASLFEDEVRQQWPTYELVFGPGGRSEVAERGYVDPPAFWKRLNRLREGAWGTDFLYITRVMWLETWLRTFRLPRPRRISVADPRGELQPAGPR